MKGFLGGFLNSDVGKSFSEETRKEVDKIAKKMHSDTESALMTFAAKSFSIIEKGVKLEDKKKAWRDKHGDKKPFPSEYVDREQEINEMIAELLDSTAVRLSLINLIPIVKAFDIISTAAKEKNDEKTMQ